MAESIFSEKTNVPNEAALHEALKDSMVLWDKALDLSGGSGEWKFYTKAAGWTYPVKQKKRTLFYMMPKDGWFQLTFVFGERAVEASKSADLPPQVLESLLNATPYVEGRSIAIDIKSEDDMETVEKLLALKLAY